MSSIITITFSPCIDKSARVNTLVPEKKLTCFDPRLEPGGGGINVARAIHKLGGEATAIYPAGGYTGSFFNHLLQKENIPAIVIDTVNHTRENFMILDELANLQYRFGMPGTLLMPDEWKRILSVIEGMHDVTYIVASGSLPPGVPADIYARIAAIAKNKHARFIVDTSGEALKHAVAEGVFLVKPNLGELSSLINHEHIDVSKVPEIARRFIHRGQCEVMLVSMGSQGAQLVTADQLFHVLPPSAERKSTVGAGDSMLAGVVLKLSENWPLKDALQYGVAAGTAATMNAGTALCTLADTEKLYALIKDGQSNRQVSLTDSKI
jgi:6-phosphofructokinase 2